MDIYQLKVFLSVYRHRSFSAAAKELHLTQPTVSVQIRNLEEELGVQLFDRAGRKSVPTREGSLLFARAEEVVARFQDIKADLSAADREVRGIIGIGATGIPGSYVIPPLAAEFTRRHPEVFFQVAIDGAKRITDRVASGELQLGIVEDSALPRGIDRMHIFRDELVLAAAPGVVNRKSISPLRLFTLPLLMREDGSDARASMEKQHLLHKISLKALNIKAILGSTDSLREAVKAGLGAAILSRFVIRDDLKAGLVEEIRITGVRMRRDFHVICRQKRSLPGHCRAFVQFLAETLPAP